MTALAQEKFEELLTTADGLPIPLQDVRITGHLNDLLSEITIKQTFCNREKVNIEAIYTFPLPMDAVLLDLTISLANRTLKGVAVEKREAEEKYEDAITDGNTVVMLQQPEPGLFTMNLGNLQAGETAIIRFTYVLLHKWNGNLLRFFLPTTIAPRYGDPQKAGLDPHQEPSVDLVIDHRFTLDISVTGRLHGTQIESPSHNIEIEREESVTTVGLKLSDASMDRDFILLFRDQMESRFSAAVDVDPEGYVLSGSFNPIFSCEEADSPRSIKIVVDCSGSMNGVSIRQTRKALVRILDSLRPQDTFNIILFGSQCRPLFSSQVKPSTFNLTRARRMARNLQADMGGTEI